MKLGFKPGHTESSVQAVLFRHHNKWDNLAMAAVSTIIMNDQDSRFKCYGLNCVHVTKMGSVITLSPRVQAIYVYSKTGSKARQNEKYSAMTIIEITGL